MLAIFKKIKKWIPFLQSSKTKPVDFKMPSDRITTMTTSISLEGKIIGNVTTVGEVTTFEKGNGVCYFDIVRLLTYKDPFENLDTFDLTIHYLSGDKPIKTILKEAQIVKRTTLGYSSSDSHLIEELVSFSYEDVTVVKPQELKENNLK